MDAAVRFSHLQIRFGAHVVHRDITFDIPRGQVVTILGPSGSGKTLLLKSIIGLQKISGGSLTVLGKQVENLEEEELRALRQDIGMLFQGAALFDSLTVAENIAYALRERKEAEDLVERVVEEKLQLVNLSGVRHKYPPELSGGQKKRVGLARALASSPHIMLFDEPTTGLDPTTIRLIDDLIIRLRDEFGISSVVVTHDIESARRVSNRWVLINAGKVIADGPQEELAEQHPDVKNFIHGNWNAEILPRE